MEMATERGIPATGDGVAKGSVRGKDPYMRGGERRYARWQVQVELGRQPVRMHVRPPAGGRCPGRIWIADDSVTETCPRCRKPLDLVGTERRQLWLSGFKKKADAEAALKRAVSDQADGRLTLPSDTTLKTYVGQWFERGGGGRKASTLHSYRANLDNHVLPSLGHVRLQDLNASQVGALLGRLRTSGRRSKKGGGLAPKTVRYVAMTLRAILASAVEDGLIGSVPINGKDVPSGDQVTSPEMGFWSQAELAAFIGSVSDPLFQTLFALAGATGMRRGEVVGLRRKDVDLERGRINVRSNRTSVGYQVQEGTPKTKRSRRTIDIGPNVTAMLKAYLHEHPMLPEALLFPVHPGSVSQTFDRAVKRTALPRIRFHDLRHSHVAHLIEQGVHPAKISARLGHASVAYTFDRYGHLFPEADAEAAVATDIAI